MQGFYYLKFNKCDFLHSKDLHKIEAQPNGYLYSNIYFKIIYLVSQFEYANIAINPYTPELLAKFIGHDVSNVERAISKLIESGLVELVEYDESTLT